jgi:hypothetical protein
MSVEIINNETTSLDYEQITQLDGIEYVLRFIWSDRESIWYMHIFDQDENELATGIALVVSFPLLRRYVDPRLPPGALVCVDTSEMGQDIQVSTDLGSRVLLMYFTADDPLLAAT